MSDERFWITNPAGHRLAEARGFYGRDGEETTFLGAPAILIVPPQLEPGTWICDICSEPILSSWGEEPMPIPLAGSYALCQRHQEAVENGPEDDPRTGDPIPGTRRGPWPLQLCACQPCTYWVQEWGRRGAFAAVIREIAGAS
jgi:hypothetical protein